MLRILIAASAVTMWIGVGCATTTELNTNVSYFETAKQNFDLGEKALKEERYQDAIAYFDYVKSKFPYTQFAALADLRIADTYFAEEKWEDAADSYELFIRFHPQHEQVAYATYQSAKSYYEAMPKNFFLFPKAYTKDQQATLKALNGLNRFLEQFPESTKVKETMEMKTEILEQLAQHDFAVGEFNEKRKKWQGAVNRYERVAALYPTTKVVAEALYRAWNICRERLKDLARSDKFLQRLVGDYPASPFAKKAQKALR